MVLKFILLMKEHVKDTNDIFRAGHIIALLSR